MQIDQTITRRADQWHLRCMAFQMTVDAAGNIVYFNGNPREENYAAIKQGMKATLDQAMARGGSMQLLYCATGEPVAPGDRPLVRGQRVTVCEIAPFTTCDNSAMDISFHMADGGAGKCNANAIDAAWTLVPADAPPPLKAHICARCGVSLLPLAGGRWKHAANGHTKGCGKAPHPVEREQYEAEMAAIVNLVRGESSPDA